MARTPLFGPFYVGRSTNLADNNLINLVPELVDGPVGSGKEVGGLYLAPGLTLKAIIPGGGIRAMRAVGNILFIISGAALYTLDTTFGVLTNLGAVGAGAACIIDNGAQVAAFTGQTGYTCTAAGATFAAITLPFTPSGPQPIRATYQDGFGFINWPSTNRQSATQVFQSNSLDLTTWNAANFASVTGDPDTLLAPMMIHRELFMIKEYETEIWYNAGNAGFAFSREEGVYPQAGCAALQSVAQVGENLMWLAQEKNGGVAVVRLEGHKLVRVSTHALELQFASYATVADAISYSYEQAGHQFYVISFPTGDATWVYDATDSGLMKVPMWHQRAAWDGAAFHRHWGQCHVFFQGMNLVGDYRNGNIYALDPAATQDNGTARKWLRSWRALPKPSENPVRFNSLRVDMQTGYATNPNVTLRVSDDGGHTWKLSRTASVGAAGANSKRVFFPRLGSTRRASGLDRILELSSSDNFAAALIGADLDAA